MSTVPPYLSPTGNRCSRAARLCGGRAVVSQVARDLGKRLGDEDSAAITYHKLGSAALEQHDLAAAEQWYRKSLAIWESLAMSIAPPVIFLAGNGCRGAARLCGGRAVVSQVARG